MRGVLAVLAAVFGSAGAAAPVPAGPKTDDPVPLAAAKLLKYRKVQKELKMTAEQRIAVYDALDDIEDEYEKLIARLEKLPNTPDEAFDKAETDRLKAIEKAVSEAADKGLTAAQRGRLRQIDRQVRGPAAFADERVQKGLQLTDEQKKVAADLARQAEGHAGRYLDELGGENEDKVKAEVFAFRKEQAAKFVDRLTADQKDAWKAMAGDPVKGFDADEFWLRLIEDDEFDAR